MVMAITNVTNICGSDLRLPETGVTPMLRRHVTTKLEIYEKGCVVV